MVLIMSETLSAKDRIIVALDVQTIDEAVAIVDEVGSHANKFKIGLELGMSVGFHTAVDAVHQASDGADVFADTKLKDIPNTMYGAGRSVQGFRPWMFNVHADNTEAAMAAAVEGAQSRADELGLATRALVIGVTVLTSYSGRDSEEIYGAGASETVIKNAKRAAKAGLDGVVCSPKEAEVLAADPATSGLARVTPGIRPEWAAAGDQKRVMSPSDAVAAGSDYLVIGRPITKPPEGITSQQAIERIIEELEG